MELAIGDRLPDLRRRKAARSLSKEFRPGIEVIPRK